MLLTDADELRAALRVALEERDEARAEVERCHNDLRMADAAMRAHARTVAERQREACALHLCPKVPHSACSNFHCEAGVVRAAPLVTEGQP